MAKREIFSGIQVTHLGGIEDIEKKSSLTGSCKHVAIADRAGIECNFVVDFGLHQGGIADNELNQDIDPKVIGADIIFVTHAHLDHIGRLPMLVTRGFKGKIIMTEATRQLAYASLSDSAFIMQQNQDAKIEQRKRLGREFALIKKYYTFVQRDDKESQDHVFIDEIEKKYTAEKINELLESLKRVDFNIPDLLPEVPVPLYTSEEVNLLFGLKKDAISLLSETLSPNKKGGNKKNSINNDPSHEETVLANTHLFDDSVVGGYQKTETDILYNDSFIETYEYGEDIKFPGIKKHNSLDGVTTSIQEITAKLYPAGHVLGSYQLEVQIGVRNIMKGDQVDTAFLKERSGNHKLWFGGDMGRHDDGNNLGTPTFPTGEYLYREMEGTYSAKNHPDRDIAIAELYSTLFQSGKHILIPTFSIQRTPDMLLLLLDYVETICLPEIERLKKINIKLKSEVSACEKLIASYKVDEDSTSMEEFQEKSDELLAKIKENEAEIDRMNVTIITDSVLYNITQNVYTKHMPDVYNELSEESQIKRFGKIIIKNLSPKESKEYFERYSSDTDKPAKNRRTKIRVSSAGMCEGGPVINHLERMVENPNSDIIFTGYAPKTTLAGKLKLDEEVIILGELYKVKAQVHDITGFSGHAGADELIEWNESGKVIKGGVDAIVHGGDDRYKLAHILSRGHKKVAVSCPQLGEIIRIKFPEEKPKKYLKK